MALRSRLLPLESKSGAPDMLATAAIAVCAGEIHRNLCPGETVLERETDAARVSIDTAVDRKVVRPGAASAVGALGHRRSCRMPRRASLFTSSILLDNELSCELIVLICELMALISDEVASPSPAAVLVARLPLASEVTSCSGPVCAACSRPR